MPLTMVNHVKSSSTSPYDALIDSLIVDCTHLCVDVQFFKMHFREEGYSETAISLVKEFDGWLAGRDLSESFINCFGVSPIQCKDPDTMRELRQLLRLGWKTVHPSSNTDEFIRTACERIALSGRHDQKSIYFHRAKRIIHQLFERIPLPSGVCLVPKHGPGSTASGPLSLPEKFSDLQWCPKWTFFSFSDLVFNDQSLETVTFTLMKHPTTKVVAVPKDSRGPRIISEEPTTSMFLQQGLWRYLERYLHRFAKEIEFRDQEKHRSLITQFTNSTLDLKDASDMVSRRLVWNLFPEGWRDLLFQLRSPFMRTSDRIYPIRAFAPMGSALCFPIEAIVHWAAVKAAQLDLPREYREPFSVYGDDIAVHANIAATVMNSLEALGLIPNRSKCFIFTPFRESCGLDVHVSKETGAIYDITPGYLRQSLRSIRTEVDALKLVDLQQKLWKFGFLNAASVLSEFILSRCPGLPVLTDMDICSGAHLLGVRRKCRVQWNESLQLPMIRSRVLEPKTRDIRISDQYLLLAVLGCGYRSNLSNTIYSTVRWGAFPIR